jgi:hypothetical protein
MDVAAPADATPGTTHTRTTCFYTHPPSTEPDFRPTQNHPFGAFAAAWR